jgi:hypothetical protein
VALNNIDPMKKILKVFITLVGIIGLLFVWNEQSRSFFKATNGEYVTMWKRWGGTCYLIPGKYYGITKPTDNYIETKIQLVGILYGIMKIQNMFCFLAKIAK